MSVTIAPAAEACQALAARINSGDQYALAVDAQCAVVAVDVQEEIKALRVDVIAEDEQQLAETLAIEDRTTHTLVIYVRHKLQSLEPCEIDAMRLIVRQIFQRVNNYDSGDGRVRVWAVDPSTRMTPDKARLYQNRLFVAKIVLRVEVEPS